MGGEAFGKESTAPPSEMELLMVANEAFIHAKAVARSQPAWQ